MSDKTEKDDYSHIEEAHPSTITEAALRGHAATDRFGNALILVDQQVAAKLRWKIDRYIIPNIFFLYLFCFIDRANIGNAKISGMEKSLGMAGLDYSYALTAFAVAYVVFEIPANLCCKRIGPGWWLPGITLVFGILSICTAFVQSFATLCTVRFLLGIAEAGMMPGIAYYLSRWYTRSELGFRIACYIVTAPLAGGFGGLLASGILKLGSIGGLTGWRLLFIVEGIITTCLALIAFVTMTDRPETARWLSADEKALAISRLKIERVATTEVLDTMDRQKILRGIFSPVTIATGFIFLLTTIPVSGLAFFLPSIIATIYPEKTVVGQQLMTVPPYMVGAVFTLLFPLLSWKLDRRNVIFIGITPLLITAYIMFLAAPSNVNVRYAAEFFIASSAFSFGVISNAQVSANVLSDTARASAIGTGVMMSNIGALIGIFIFQANDAPLYIKANSANLALALMTWAIAIGLEVFMRKNNQLREKRDVDAELAGLEQKQIQDLDWKNPAWRWKP